MKFLVLNNLLTDIILGQSFLKLCNQVQISFGGPKPALRNSALHCININAVPRLFDHLTIECKPIITKSRKHLMANEKLLPKLSKTICLTRNRAE